MANYLQQQEDLRLTALHAARSFTDLAAEEKREMTAEENASYDSATKEIEARSDRIAEMIKDNAAFAEVEAAVRTAPELRDGSGKPETSDFDVIRKLASGEIRSATFERRALNTSDDSSLIPSDFYSVLQEKMQYQGPMLDTTVVTRLNTADGNDMKVPVESTRPAGTAIAEATTITALDPTFASLTLKDQKLAVLTKVSSEFLRDSGIDIVNYLAGALGKSLGIKANGLLTLGTGTVEPNGVSVASSAGGTGATAVSGAFTADNLLDLAYTVDSDYLRGAQGGAYMMRRSSLGELRKLKDTAGQYLYMPTQLAGNPDLFAGYPVLENPDVAATATSAKSVLFGAFNSYIVRHIGGIEIVRSDEAYFASDEVGFRAIVHIWGDLGQTGAVKHFVGGAS